MATSTGPALNRPAVILSNTRDGVMSNNGQIIGTYLHGLFENRHACDALLKWAGLKEVVTSNCRAMREMDRLANEMEARLDIDRLLGT